MPAAFYESALVCGGLKGLEQDPVCRVFIYEAAYYVLLVCLQEGVWADMRSVINADEASVSVTESCTDLTGFDWLMPRHVLLCGLPRDSTMHPAPFQRQGDARLGRTTLFHERLQ